jgi:hypothetical protein
MGVRLTALPPIRPEDAPLKYRTESFAVKAIKAGSGFPLCKTNCWGQSWLNPPATGKGFTRRQRWAEIFAELKWRVQSRSPLSLPVAGVGFMNEWAEVFDWEIDDSWLDAFNEDDSGASCLEASDDFSRLELSEDSSCLEPSEDSWGTSSSSSFEW